MVPLLIQLLCTEVLFQGYNAILLSIYIKGINEQIYTYNLAFSFETFLYLTIYLEYYTTEHAKLFKQFLPLFFSPISY